LRLIPGPLMRPRFANDWTAWFACSKPFVISTPVLMAKASRF